MEAYRKVMFSHPYMLAPDNHWSSPYLDEDAKAVREDNQLKNLGMRVEEALAWSVVYEKSTYWVCWPFRWRLRV
jgi:hypothetical protein